LELDSSEITERLYYHDCYQTEFEARVVDRGQNGCRIYLDRSAFYPASGGQPNDLGTLAGQLVVDVIDEDARVAHVVENPLPAGFILGRIDWARRYDHMQQHTGQHLLSAVFVELFGFRTVSFHLGSEVSTIELAVKEIAGAQLEEAEQRANKLVREARPVGIYFEDAESVQGLRKPSQRSGTLRVIEIEGVDRSACGGTHVRSTAELGPIQIRRTEKIRSNTRLEFVCGARASRRAKQDFQILLELARQSATPIDKVPEYFSAVRDRLAEAEQEKRRLLLVVARREGEMVYDSTAPSDDGVRRVRLAGGQVDDALRAKAQAVTDRGKAVVLAVAADVPGVLIACSADTGLNAGIILKEALSEVGGRGGGSAVLAQGSLPGPEVAQALAKALGFD
jgi:alanyl-tRNA synthetase